MKIRFFIPVFFCLLAGFFFESFYSGNMDAPDPKRNNESFAELSDSLIKRDIASFSLAGSSQNQTDSFPEIKLTVIPLIWCGDSGMYFEKGNIIALDRRFYVNAAKFDTAGHKLTYAGGKLVQIDGNACWGTDGAVPKQRLKRITYIRGEYFDVDLPDNAFADLYEPVFCTGKVATGKRNVENISNSKAFISEDGKRVYLYMRNGAGNSSYEVTWVIQGGKYLTRVVDKVNETVR